MTVPFAWGTYAPVVKYVYEMDPPVPGFIFSGGYYLIAAVTLSILSFLQHRSFLSKNPTQSMIEDNSVVDTINIDLNEYGEPLIQKNDQLLSSDRSTSNQEATPFIAGLELGSYLFIGNCLQVIGLKTVPADRAAFLVQLTTIMVPLFQALFAGDLFAIPTQTWIACIMAFFGVVIMGFDGADVESLDLQSIMSGSNGLSFSYGDSFIVAAAVAYTMHVIRLGRYAKFTTPLGLAASKATIEAIFSILLVSFLMTTGPSSFTFLNDMSTEVKSYLETLNEQISLGQFPPKDSTKIIGAILWTGWVTCAYTIYAQSFGQSRVKPADANLIYSIQPLFSALFAFVLLGESLGPSGWIGGSLIASSLWIVTASKDENKNNTDPDQMEY
jgi:drug/metabolite transporter (DMT)-like permease